MTETVVPRKFSKLLLPTLGGPKIARRMPARRISPRRLSDKIECILFLKPCARCRAVPRVSAGNRSWQKRDVYITLFEHTLLEILTLAEINERLDERETADDFFSKYMKLLARLALKKSRYWLRGNHTQSGKGHNPPGRRTAPRAAGTLCPRPRGHASPRPASSRACHPHTRGA